MKKSDLSPDKPSNHSAKEQALTLPTAASSEKISQGTAFQCLHAQILLGKRGPRAVL